MHGYMRNKSDSIPRIAQLVKPNGSFMGSDGKTAEILNKFFQSVFINVVVLLNFLLIAIVSCLT